MPDDAADVIADALTHHHARAVNWRPGTTVPSTCTCGATDLSNGDRWEAHLADVTVAALTQAGHLICALRGHTYDDNGAAVTAMRPHWTATRAWCARCHKPLDVR